MKGLVEYQLERHVKGRDMKLVMLRDAINWEILRGYLKGIHKNDEDAQGGQKPYDHIRMFKALILQQWHSLSDEELETSLRLRIDFILFTEFPIGEVPDATTICRFRNKLVEKNKFKTLLKKVNQQLKEKKLQVEVSNGAIIDATIIESQAQPNKVTEVIVEDRNEDDSDNDSGACVKETFSKDPDARWLKKGKKCFFGYKGFATCDDEGYILKTSMQPANAAECKELDEMTTEIEAKRAMADKAYASKANRALLKEKGLKNGILYKASKGKKLSHWQKKFNKIVSKSRYVIEQCFGTLKRRFKFQKASYFTLVKVEAQFDLKAICMNLNKAMNKIMG